MFNNEKNCTKNESPKVPITVSMTINVKETFKKIFFLSFYLMFLIQMKGTELYLFSLVKWSINWLLEQVASIIIEMAPNACIYWVDRKKTVLENFQLLQSLSF